MSGDGQHALIAGADSRLPTSRSRPSTSLTVGKAATLALGAVALGSLITGALALGPLSLARPLLRLEPPRPMRRSAPRTRIAVAWVRVIWTDQA
jgi:hypothetical protein